MLSSAKILISVLLGFGIAPVLLAADRPADCITLASESARLTCYDSFFMGNKNDDVTAITTTTIKPVSSLEARLEEEANLRDRWFAITAHKPNYILPATYNASADYEKYGPAEDFLSDSEIKFQLSIKTDVLTDLWRDSTVYAAYTQQSYWQLFADDELSAPFRETNHQPEIAWQIPLNFELFGFQAQIATIAFNHQSNGRSEPLSKSWNRITGELAMDKGPLVLSAKTWVRIDDPDVDDNPNIEDYMGRISLGAAYKGERHTFAVGIKNSLDSEFRSGIELNWTFPLDGQLRGFLQVYSGYGENLIDMEDYTNRIGLGVILTDWL